MKFNIVIPTYHRIKKLERCINSIRKQTYQNYEITVICDNNDKETYEFMGNKYCIYQKMSSFLMKKHLYVAGCWNWFTKNYFEYIKDNMIWLCDDTAMYPDCLEQLNKFINNNFENKDYVVGLKQIVPGCPRAESMVYGQVVLGKEYIARFPNYQVCAPCFTFWYQDQENYLYARSLGKFKFCKTALINHYHPCYIKEEIDTTHKLSRGDIQQKDKQIFEERQKQGLLWGRDKK